MAIHAGPLCGGSLDTFRPWISRSLSTSLSDLISNGWRDLEKFHGISSVEMKVIWKHWTYKMLVNYILSGVCLELSPFSQLSFMQNRTLCDVSLPILFWWLWEYFTSSHHHYQSEIWINNHYLGLGHETMVYIFYVLITLCLIYFLLIQIEVSTSLWLHWRFWTQYAVFKIPRRNYLTFNGS